MIQLKYSSKKLEKQCTSMAAMQKAYGPEISKQLSERIFQLRTSDTLGDLLTPAAPGKWETLSGDRKGEISARVSANQRLIVTTPDTSNPKEATVVRVERVEDYHKK